ncbi:MAG: methylated-DNA--[protein]-cysteine S-methyltransferase [Methanobacteriaceae archaeon]
MIISNNIIISIYSDEKLHFAVAIKNDKIIKTVLPKTDEKSVVNEISTSYTSYKLSDKYRNIAKKICRAYYGKEYNFDVDIPNKSNFRGKVLLEVAKIPYGEVRTYKQIAEVLNTEAYRAVGTAVGRNPFPIIIPCHRVVKSDLRVGGFFGGTEMKTEMLKNEGVRILDGKVIKKKA